MKSIDIKSVIIGVLGTILVFVSIGAKSQYEHLSDIVCNSITVLDNGTGGYIKISNSGGKQTSYLGTAENGDGFLSTSNSDGKQTSYLGTAENGDCSSHFYFYRNRSIRNWRREEFGKNGS
jgi:hypothetical protein